MTDSNRIVFVVTMAVSEVFPLAPVLSLFIYKGAIKKLIVINLQVEQLGQIFASSLENRKVNISLNPIPSVPLNFFSSFLVRFTLPFFFLWHGLHLCLYAPVWMVLVT